MRSVSGFAAIACLMGASLQQDGLHPAASPHSQPSEQSSRTVTLTFDDADISNVLFGIFGDQEKRGQEKADGDDDQKVVRRANAARLTQSDGLTREQREAVREGTAIARQALDQAAQEMLKLGTTTTFNFDGQDHLTMLDNIFNSPEPNVDVDVDGVSLNDAVKRVFAQCKLDYDIAADVPADSKVTLRVKHVRLSTALQAITEQAGVVWTKVLQRKRSDTKFQVRYRISRAGGPPQTGAPSLSGPFYLPRVPMTVSDTPSPPVPTSFVFSVAEQRQVFTCPHCKGRVTTVRPRSARPFSRGLRPNDDTRVSGSASSGAAVTSSPAPVWRFCPLCGKPVCMEESDDASAVAADRLEPGRQVRIEVVSAPDDKEYNGVYPVLSDGRIRLRTYPISIHVNGMTIPQLEAVVTAQLKQYLKEPRVKAAIVSK